MSFDIHVCMVSGQAAPNLLPLLDAEMKPKKIILLVTPQMEQKAGFLKEVVMPRGIQVEIRKLESADDFAGIQDLLLELLAENENQRIALNVTGGTKWMAIAAQEVFRSNKQPVFYVDVDTDRVLFLADESIPPHTLSQRIDFANYLKVYGYRVNQEEKPSLQPEWRDLVQELVLHTIEWEKALGYLNRVASDAEGRNSLKLNLNEFGDQPVYLDALFRECHRAGVTKSSSLSSIEFASSDARRFCNGGWLEVYVSRLLGELRGDGLLQDPPHLNIQVQTGNSHNEIDVAFMARNRLHLIECKTKRMSGDRTGQAGVETVYRLDSLSELGGIGTKSMLVSYRKLRNADRQRATDLRIKVVEGPDLINLKDHLRRWINGR